MNTLQHRGQYEEELHESPLLKTTCRYPVVSSQMNQKIETASTVLSQYLGVSTSYKYDAKGHLVEASMPTCYEDYSYNSIGQRISMLHTRKGIFHYTYDAQGKLTQVNDTRFQYDSLGRLSGTTAPNIPAKRFVYERVRIGDLDIDRLSTFQDSTGKSYTYSYTPNNPLPIVVQSYGQPVVTYQWDESGALPRLLGCTTSLATWQFGYLPENDGRLPDTVILTGPVVAKLGYWDLKSLQCKLGYDHLATVKLIADPFNELVKELFYDSFGNIVSETEQRIYFPLGFAGGLRDIASGFVCFGFRDYDPSVGRFTTPDPALDVRGGGDIYDYCVDDPVNLRDINGLAWTDFLKPIQKFVEKLLRDKAEMIESQTDTPDSNREESLLELMVKILWGAKSGGLLGAAEAAVNSDSGKKFESNARELDIPTNDSTSITYTHPSFPSRTDPEPRKPDMKNSTRITHSGSSCTPQTQPRTSDGRFTFCHH